MLGAIPLLIPDLNRAMGMERDIADVDMEREVDMDIEKVKRIRDIDLNKCLY